MKTYRRRTEQRVTKPTLIAGKFPLKQVGQARPELTFDPRLTILIAWQTRPLTTQDYWKK